MKKIGSLFLALGIALHVLAQEKYQEDRVQFPNADGTIRIGATISYPVKKKDATAIVLVSGGGQQDRDCDMAGHKLFAILADYLSGQGFVVLRMDDRGVGETTGVYMDATTADFGKDALSAISYLKANTKKYGATHFGVLGHSEGGAAAAIAASLSSDVEFIVSYAGLAMNGLESLFWQNENLVALSPLQDVDKKRSNEINKLMFATAYQYADSSNMEQQLNDAFNTWKERDDAFFKTLGQEFDRFRFPIWRYVNEAITPWYRYLVRYNAEMILRQVRVPVLAFNGDRDIMVSPHNLELWKSRTAAGGNTQVSTVLVPNLNHLMQACKTCDMAEYRTLGTIPVPIMKQTADWISSLKR